MAKKQLDPVVAAWRRSLHCLIHPHLPVLETLQEMVDRLDAVKGFLDTLDAADKVQAAQGVEVGAVAIAYADKLLEHFGLWGGVGAAPPPANLTQARLVVGNLLSFVEGQIESRRTAIAAGDEDRDDESEDCPEAAAVLPPAPVAVKEEVPDGGPMSVEAAPPALVSAIEAAPPELAPAAESVPHGLVVDRETFSVRYRGRACSLGHTKEFLLIECLNRRVGRYVEILTLTEEAWDGENPEPNTIQRTVSSLRKKLKDAGIFGPVIKPQRGHYALILP